MDRELFISHLHEDHVNGLEYLLNYCNVKNIVFPLIYEIDKYIYAIRYLCDSPNHNKDDFTYRFIQSPSEVIRNFSPDTNIFALNYGDENSVDNKSNEDIGQVEIIRSGSNVLEKLNDISIYPIEKIWEYIPFNFRESLKKDKFYKILSNKLNTTIDDSKIKSILSNWGNGTIEEKVKDSYKEINKDLNLNSLVLFSGTKDSKIKQILIEPYCGKCCCRCILNRCHKPNGCLYMGDYNANGKLRWKDLKNCYMDYWNSIGCIQLPHHGSMKSYNHNIALIDAYHVASAGRRNTYHHPHAYVIRDLLFEKKYPFIVTEESSSRFTTEILL